ncbi:MAG: DUF4328 domain-containing protein [Nannocystaceae bacterium]|nr:DUF4328 domain-containing protein [Nannocystaceae bacterium]
MQTFEFIIPGEMSANPGPNPYAAPVDDAEPERLAAAAVGYRDQGTRLSIVAMLLGLYSLTILASMWSCMAANGVVPAVFAVLEPRDIGTQGPDVLFVVSNTVYLMCAAGIGAFLVRANHNARRLGGPDHGMTTSPGWTVGWFFIPFANWVRPYRAVKEIWMVSQPDRSGPLPIWWALWLITSLGGRIADKISERAETWDEIIRSNWLNFAHNGFAIAAALAVFLVVRGLHENQQQHASALS